jgi:hypothetical protein
MITVILTFVDKTITISVNASVNVRECLQKLQNYCQRCGIKVPIAYSYYRAVGSSQEQYYIADEQLPDPLDTLTSFSNEPHFLALKGHYDISLSLGGDVEPYKLYPLPKLVTVSLTIPGKKLPTITKQFPSTVTVRNCLLYFQNACLDRGISVPITYKIKGARGDGIPIYYLSSTLEEYHRKPVIELIGDDDENKHSNNDNIKLYPLPYVPLSFFEEEDFWKALAESKSDLALLHKLLGVVTEFKLGSINNSTLVNPWSFNGPRKLQPIYKTKMRLLLSILRDNRSICSLDLSLVDIFSPPSFFTITNPNVETAIALSRLITANQNLTSLNLACAEMDAATFGIIKDALITHPSIELLLIGWNKFSIGDVADLIEKNSTIKILSLRHLDTSDKDVNRFSAALKKNSTLESIDLYGNEITSAGLRTLAVALKDNHSITKLNLLSYSKLRYDETAIADFYKEIEENLFIKDLSISSGSYDDHSIIKRNKLLNLFFQWKITGDWPLPFPIGLIELIREYCFSQYFLTQFSQFQDLKPSVIARPMIRNQNDSKLSSHGSQGFLSHPATPPSLPNYFALREMVNRSWETTDKGEPEITIRNTEAKVNLQQTATAFEKLFTEYHQHEAVAEVKDNKFIIIKGIPYKELYNLLQEACYNLQSPSHVMDQQSENIKIKTL